MVGHKILNMIQFRFGLTYANNLNLKKLLLCIQLTFWDLKMGRWEHSYLTDSLHKLPHVILTTAQWSIFISLEGEEIEYAIQW